MVRRLAASSSFASPASAAAAPLPFPPLSRCHSGVTFHQSHDVSHLSGGEASIVANERAQKKCRVFATPLHPLAEEAAANGRRGLRFVAYLRALSRNSNITVHCLSGWAQLIHFYVKSQGKHIT